MAARRKAVVAAKAVHYPDLSPKAYEHPADRAATAALRAIPGLDTAVRWLIEQGYERALFQQNLAASLLVGPDQLPGVWSGWTNVVNALDLPTPSGLAPALYVAQDPWLNAMAIGSQNPYVVVTSKLVETATGDELRAVMAHEAGHILSGHVTYQTALTILVRASLPSLGPGALPLAAIRLALLEWFRAAELSCDRAAALAVDDPQLVVQMLMVLGAGLPSASLSLEAFQRQAAEYEDWSDGPDRLRRFVANVSRTHPTAVRRASELSRWVASGEFERVRSGDYARRIDEPGVRANAADAVGHYADRFRDIFSSAGDSVAKAGSRFQSWLRPTGSATSDPDGSDRSDPADPSDPSDPVHSPEQ